MQVELPHNVGVNIGRFSGRNWLLPHLLDWWNTGNERFFLLIGDPGTGKSMLSAWLAGHGPAPPTPAESAQLSALRAAVSAVYFCQANETGVGPKVFVESVIDQLLRNVPEYRAIWSARAGKEIVAVNTGPVESGAHVAGINAENFYAMIGEAPDTRVFHEHFVQPLEALYAKGYQGRLLILIDGLDEEFVYDGATVLPHLLGRLQKLPPQVRFLLTTRNEDRVLEHFRGQPSLNLITDQPPKVDDVREFASARLRGSALQPARAQDLATRLSKAAEGVFLYAAMVLDELLPRLTPQFDLEQYPLPHGLPALYLQFMQRELGIEDKGRRWDDVYRPMLGYIAVAQGLGLDAKQLRGLIGAPVSSAIRACRQYLKGAFPAGPFRVFHKSFADFLLEKSPDERYRVDPVEAHAEIAAYLWKKFARKWQQSDEYTLNALAAHLADGHCFDKFEKFLSRGWLQARAANDRFDRFASDVDRIWAASRSHEDRTWALTSSFRCALLRGSINSSARGYPVGLVARALELGVWSAERALSLQETLPAEAAIRLAAALLATGKLSRPDAARALARALAIAQLMPNPAARANAYAAIARVPQAAVREDALEQGARAAREIADPHVRGNALLALAAAASDSRQSLLREALVCVEQVRVQSEWAAAYPLESLAALADEVTAQSLWRVARTLPTEVRVRVGVAILQKLSKDRRVEAAIELAEVVAQTLDQLWTPGNAGREQTLQRARQRAAECLEMLHLVVPSLDQAAKDRLKEAAKGWRTHMDPQSFFRWTFETAPLLDPAQLNSVLQEARQLPPGPPRLQAYAWLAHLSEMPKRESLFAELESSIGEWANAEARARAFADWLPLLAGQTAQRLRAQLLRDIYEVVASEQGMNETVAGIKTVFSRLLECIDATQADDAARVALLPMFRTYRDESLEKVAGWLSAEGLALALRVTGEIQDLPFRARAFTALASRLTTERREKALGYAQDLLPNIDAYARAKCIARLVPMFFGKDREALLRSGIQSVLYSASYAPIALAQLAPYLPASLAREAIVNLPENAFAGRFLTGVKPECIAILAGRLEGEERRARLSGLLDELPINGTGNVERLFVQLVELAEGELLERCREKAARLSVWQGKAEVLTAIAAKLSGAERQAMLIEAGAAAKAVDQPFTRFNSQTRVAALFEGGARARAVADLLRAFENLPGVAQRAAALPALVPLLDERTASDRVTQTLADLHSLDESARTAALQHLMPVFDLDQLQTAMQIAIELPTSRSHDVVVAQLCAAFAGYWPMTQPRDPLFATLSTVLFHFRDSERRATLTLLEELLVRNAPLDQELVAKLADELAELSNDWRFDSAALAAPTAGVRHVR